MKKRCFKGFRIIMSAILVILCVVYIDTNNVNAAEKVGYQQEIGKANKNYNDEFINNSSNKSLLNPLDLLLSNNNVSLEHNGYSAFIDAIVKLSTGDYLNVSDVANWMSEDTSVAMVYNGRIIAIGEGSTTINVTYNNLRKSIKVNVLGNVDLRSLLTPNSENALSSVSSIDFK